MSDPATCRICFEGDIVKNLCSPCACDGSMKYVHKECLGKWLSTSHSNKNTCETCAKEYNILKVIVRENEVELDVMKEMFRWTFNIVISFSMHYFLTSIDVFRTSMICDIFEPLYERMGNKYMIRFFLFIPFSIINWGWFSYIDTYTLVFISLYAKFSELGIRQMISKNL